jgi:hypothetical protein
MLPNPPAMKVAAPETKTLSRRLLKMIAAVEMNNRSKTNIKTPAVLERRRKHQTTAVKTDAALERRRKQRTTAVKIHVALERMKSLMGVAVCRLAVKVKQVLAAMVRMLSSALLYLY